MILLKNALCLSISAKQSKNKVLIKTMWNVIYSSNISKLTDLINVALFISNIKLAELAVFLLSWIEVSSCCNTFNWPMPPVNRVEVSELINNSLNLVLLYCGSLDELKT